jgi:hypothetical protein
MPDLSESGVTESNIFWHTQLNVGELFMNARILNNRRYPVAPTPWKGGIQPYDDVHGRLPITYQGLDPYRIRSLSRPRDPVRQKYASLHSFAIAAVTQQCRPVPCCNMRRLDWLLGKLKLSPIAKAAVLR